MQIEVAKKDLEAALRVAEIGTGSGGDISSHFLFRVRDGAAEILTWNQRVCVRVPIAHCTLDGADGEAFTVEATRLSRWLAGVGDAAVTISKLGDGEVRLAAPKSTIEIGSLDPSKYAFWDSVLDAASKTSSVSAARLSAALAYVRNFIADNSDTTRPEIAQTEVMDGVLWATDKKAMTLVTLDVLAAAKFRLHGKDVGSVTKFLGIAGGADVEVLEHDRQMFIRRTDGAVLGVVRPITAFPAFKVDRGEDDPIRWEIRTEDLLRGIKCLSAAAESMDNPRIRFNFDDGNVVLGVSTASGKRNVYQIGVLEHEGTENLPDDGFVIEQSYIDKVVKMFGTETLKFGIHKRNEGGFVRFRHCPKDTTDDYLTVVVWRT